MSLPSAPVDLLPEVYVLWHPRCRVGATAARRIYDWLRPGHGLGPKVFYRSLPAPKARDGLPLPLPGEARAGVLEKRHDQRANLQIVLPLIDDNMIADPRFRYWLTELGANQPAGFHRTMLPVALDSTAFGAPPPLRELNFLRPKVPRALDELTASELELLLRSLLKQLTEALCKLMLGTTSAPVAGAEALKLKVFLSHAKADGTVPARRVRDYIYSQTQLAAFYDENDIPFGSAFERVLRNEATSTVALIAVRSSRYADRPWCRREISMFRKPRRVSPILGQPAEWRLNPVLVVSALDASRSTVGVPEFGNSPELRWSGEVIEQEEQIVTMLLRDAMLSQFHAVMGRLLDVGPDSIVLNWLPDPISLLQVDGIRHNTECRVHYPGHLSDLDLAMLWQLFPDVRFKSFEECVS